MKNTKKIFIILAAFVVLVLSSCATSVNVQTLVPAEVSLGSVDRSVAIAPATISAKASQKIYSSTASVQLRGYSYDYVVPNDIAYFSSLAKAVFYDDLCANVTNCIETSLNQGFYRIVNADKTESLIFNAKRRYSTVRDTLKENGIGVLITADIFSADYDEYISNEVVKKDEGTVIKFYLHQKAQLGVSVLVQDVDNFGIIDTFNLSGNYPSSTYEDTVETFLGEIGVDGKFVKADYNSAPTAEYMFGKIIRNFSKQLTEHLMPHYSSSNLTLWKNETKDEVLEGAYKLVDENNLAVAVKVFEDHYNLYGDVPSGYNTALIYYSVGNYDKALSVAQNLYNRTLNADVLSLVYKINDTVESQNKAIQQMNGEAQVSSAERDLIGF